MKKTLLNRMQRAGRTCFRFTERYVFFPIAAHRRELMSGVRAQVDSIRFFLKGSS